MPGKVHSRENRIEASICQCVVVRHHFDLSMWVVCRGRPADHSVGSGWLGCPLAMREVVNLWSCRLRSSMLFAAGEHGGVKPMRANPALSWFFFFF
jgi:hypothetical protein